MANPYTSKRWLFSVQSTVRSLMKEHVLIIILRLFPPCLLLVEPVCIIFLSNNNEKVF